MSNATAPTPPAQTARKPLPWRRRISRNSKHFNSDDMPKDGRDLTVKIEAVADGKLEGFFGGKKGDPKDTVFLKFVGHKKALGLNSTNADTIEMIHGTDIPEEWIGKLVTLFVDPTVRGGDGKKREGIRVRPRKPTEQQWLASQAGYKPPPFDLELALKEIASTETVEDLEQWRRDLRAVPKEHVERVRDEWAKRKTKLEQSGALDLPVEPDPDAETL